MPYTDFTLDSLLAKFDIVTEIAVLFPDLAPVVPPHDLEVTLANSMDLALLSEKARSEYIVAPVLMAVRLMLDKRIAIYSGQRLDVDPATGLYGECDFLLTTTKPLPFIRHPLSVSLKPRKTILTLDLVSVPPRCWVLFVLTSAHPRILVPRMAVSQPAKPGSFCAFKTRSFR